MNHEMEVCPYNKAHMIVRSRMPNHLHKCVKNYRGETLENCPFNFMHKVPKSELKEHFKTCKEYRINEIHSEKK